MQLISLKGIGISDRENLISINILSGSQLICGCFFFDFFNTKITLPSNRYELMGKLLLKEWAFSVTFQAPVRLLYNAPTVKE